MTPIREVVLFCAIAVLVALGSGCVAGGSGTTLFNGSTTLTLDQQR
jgi:hypothetical protein